MRVTRHAAFASFRPLPGPLPGRAALALALALAALLAAPPVRAAFTETDARKLASLSLEELMQVEVTTVAGVGQARISAPAALSVISAEDIRRSGHRSLAEALRMVPGMYVGQVNSSSWLVGTRGLTASSITANRYLVLIDGRVIYDPLLSSTFWDVNDVLLDDIDRIEVIRGPGATLWGVNAMNGVINVITRDAQETTGTLARLGHGSHERGFAAVRHGAAFDGGAWRAWGRYDRRGDFENAAGVSIEDQWSSLRGGFRADWGDPSAFRSTLAGQVYSLPTSHFATQQAIPGQHLQTERIEGHEAVDGGHLRYRAQHDDGAGAGWSLQAYYDRNRRDSQRLSWSRQTWDVDFRRWARWGERNEWIWGVQYGTTSDETGESAIVPFDPRSRTIATVNAFVQNTSELVPQQVFLMLGSKFTHHEFVGGHVQPALRLWWTPSAAQTVWAAVSRPVRTPSRLEEEGALIFSYVDTGLLAGQPATGVIVPLGLFGDDELPVEKLTAWEFGHRWQPGARWSLDTSFFYNDYARLISVPPGIFGHFNALGSGSTRGVEFVAAWRATDAWRLEGAWSWLDTRIDGPVLQFDETSSPRTMAQLRSYLDLGEDWEFNAALYHVDAIERTAIDAYRRLDLGLTWRASERLELALWGQNLSEEEHAEASGALVPRSVYLQATVRFD
jgi:iron complex outermembrane recepter protein